MIWRPTNLLFDFLQNEYVELEVKELNIQSDSSNACGYFVCFFLINRELGLSFNEILSKFTKNYRKNQTLVKLYLNKMRE